MATLSSLLRQLVLRAPPAPEFGAIGGLLSLPFALGLGAAAAQPASGYLPADAALIAEWRPRVAIHDGLCVGLMWRGDPDNLSDARRSLPMEVAARFGEFRDGMTWFKLQADADPERPQPRPFPMIDLPLRDFADTAALIASLDLVISVDSSVAHAAGAVGTPLWLVSQAAPGWRWQMGDRENPWYRDVTMFRPAAPRDRAPVVERVMAALRSRARP